MLSSQFSFYWAGAHFLPSQTSLDIRLCLDIVNVLPSSGRLRTLVSFGFSAPVLESQSSSGVWLTCVTEPF